jgi:hypothetical protein
MPIEMSLVAGNRPEIMVISLVLPERQKLKSKTEKLLPGRKRPVVKRPVVKLHAI